MLSDYGLDLIIATQHYMAMTAEQVKVEFAKWLRPADLIQVYPRADTAIA